VLEYSSGSGSRQVVQKPSLWAISLATDQVIWRYEFPSSSVPGDGMGMISVVLDDDDCSNIFAYIPDVYTNAIVVVDTKNAKSWRFTHNYFRSNPFEGDFDVDGFKFQWDDGIFSIALSNKKPDGFKTAFFHPLAAHGEFTVSTKILRNENLASRTWHDKDFKFIGFDTKSNRGIHVFDSNKRVLFFAEMQKNGVSCWNPKGKEQLRSSEVHMIAQNNQTMIYPVDIEVRKITLSISIEF
jgi:dopachrome tautomerase